MVCIKSTSDGTLAWLTYTRGPLLFSLLLSFLLSRGAKDDQKPGAFSGVFAMVWIGKAVVTMQIRLLGGHMQVFRSRSASKR